MTDKDETVATCARYGAEALRRAMSDDPAGAIDALEQVYEAGDEIGLLACTFSWAELLRQALDLSPDRGDAFAARMQIVEAGRTVEPEDAPPDIRSMIFGSRMLTLGINRDHETAVALWNATPDDEIVDGVVAVLCMVAQALAAHDGDLSGRRRLVWGMPID